MGRGIRLEYRGYAHSLLILWWVRLEVLLSQGTPAEKASKKDRSIRAHLLSLVVYHVYG